MRNYLLIDDDEIINKIHPIIIGKVDKDCCVEICSNAVEAIEYLNQLLAQGGTPPNFIFLDINMPIMSGFEFLEKLSDEIKSFLKESKIILLSSSIDPADKVNASKFENILEFAPKPLTVPYLNNLLSL
jgi:two-component SAPR family response regulator